VFLSLYNLIIGHGQSIHPKRRLLLYITSSLSVLTTNISTLLTLQTPTLSLPRKNWLSFQPET
jgi:hypothetical protein